MLSTKSVRDSISLLPLVCSLVCCISLAVSIIEGSQNVAAPDASDQVEVSSPRPATAAPTNNSRRGNPTASDRLMRELQKVHKSGSYKRGLYTVDLVDESLYEWRVKITPAMFDADSELHKDLLRLNEQGKKGHVELSFEFKDTFPFSPPFVRIVYPILQSRMGGGLFGGAICMDIFTPQGWSSAYKIEAAILQVILRLVEIDVRVVSSEPAEVAAANSPEKAQEGFQTILGIHRDWKA